MTIASFTGLAHFRSSAKWKWGGGGGGGGGGGIVGSADSGSSSWLISSAQRLVETPDATDNSAWPVFRHKLFAVGLPKNQIGLGMRLA